MAIHCPKCKQTVILLSEWAIKPEKGDMWLLQNMCVDDMRHNIDLPPVEYPLVKLPYFVLESWR